MCCQRTTPGRSIQKSLQHQTFAKEKFRDSIVTTSIMSCGQKHLFKKKFPKDSSVVASLGISFLFKLQKLPVFTVLIIPVNDLTDLKEF